MLLEGPKLKVEPVPVAVVVVVPKPPNVPVGWEGKRMRFKHTKATKDEN